MSYLLDISRPDLLYNIKTETVKHIIKAVTPSKLPLECMRRLVILFLHFSIYLFICLFFYFFYFLFILFFYLHIKKVSFQ